MSFSSRVKEELSRQIQPGETLSDCGNCGNFKFVRPEYRSLTGTGIV